MTDFTDAFARCPLVAILRGVRPQEVEALGEELVEAGFSLIEVPLNSPDPFSSIERLASRIGDRAMVGAGTVLSVDEVRTLSGAGGRMAISPGSDPAVIGATIDAGLISIPGFQSPSEGFAAISAGASALKLFPAEASSPAVLRALRAVLPASIPVLPVGGITHDTMAPWLSAGASGFGLGSALYRPGMDAVTLGRNARAFVASLGKVR